MASDFHVFDCQDCLDLNSELASTILGLTDDAYRQCSHFFHGRFENRYIETSSLPLLKTILDIAQAQAAEILNQPVTELKRGFWLNIMNKGDITTLHSHDEDDELLSAVYYIQVPSQSGLFKLHTDDGIREIRPVAGRFMFFDPALPHEVSRHQSDSPRISVGINFGPK